MSRTDASGCTVGDAVRLFETIAPPWRAQEWDNVGLLAGSVEAPCRRILCCIDMSGPVVEEAIGGKADLILAYHPPLFRPVKTLHGDGSDTQSLVWRAISHGIAIYSMHTALDAADGGTNDVLGRLAGLGGLEPFELVADPAVEMKLVTFVPAEQVEKVAGAMAGAGAGQIGNYSHCSFRIPGQGTFFGSEAAAPVVGQKGRLERVEEIRLEMVVPQSRLAEVIAAMVAAHPYEEPAYDVYPLQPKPVRKGIGRCGAFTRETTLGGLARKLKKAVGASGVQIVGEARTVVHRAAVCAGAAGLLPLERRRSADCDCIITGEIRHHDALTLLRNGKTGIALGHWASERPVLGPLAERIEQELPAVVTVSRADADPFHCL